MIKIKFFDEYGRRFCANADAYFTLGIGEGIALTRLSSTLEKIEDLEKKVFLTIFFAEK